MTPNNLPNLEKSVKSETPSTIKGAENLVQNKELDLRKKAQDNKKAEMKIPQVNFINQEKIVKRPLSKNVYTAKTEKTNKKSNEKKEPVVIIENENKSKAGTVIAIIIAIILGAIAGTVVFFLIPK